MASPDNNKLSMGEVAIRPCRDSSGCTTQDSRTTSREGIVPLLSVARRVSDETEDPSRGVRLCPSRQ